MAPERALADTALEHEHRSSVQRRKRAVKTPVSEQVSLFKHVSVLLWMKIAIHYTPEI